MSSTEEEPAAEPSRGQRGAPGRAGLPDARGAGAAQRRRAVDVPGGRRPRPATAGRSDGRRARVRGLDGPGAALGRRVAAGRRGRGDRRAAPPVLPDGRRGRFAGGGGGESRPAHSSRSERMSTPDAGLRLEGRRLLRQQPVGARRPAAPGRSRAPASARRRCAAGRPRPRASSTEWCVADRARRASASAGSRSSCSSSTAARSSARRQLERRPVVPVGRDQVVGREGGRARPDGPAARLHGGSERRSRSASVEARAGSGGSRRGRAGCRPGRPASPGRASVPGEPGCVGAAAGGRRRSGGGRRRSAARASRARRAMPVEVGRVADRPDPVVLPGPVGELVLGGRRAGRSREQVAQADAGARWTSRIGAGFMRISAIRSASSSAWAGWMPSCGKTATSSRSRRPG